jgi:osmotically-inducible protein OsmY
MRHTRWALIAVLGLGLSGVACDDTLRGVQKDTQENTAIAKQKAEDAHLDEAAAKAAEEAKKAAVAAKEGLSNIARDIKNGDDDRANTADDRNAEIQLGKEQARLDETGREISREVKEAGIHVDVKQALLRDESIDASHVNVDVEDNTRTVVLRGSVPTLDQKAAAERISAARSKGYRVRNELAVIGR